MQTIVDTAPLRIGGDGAGTLHFRRRAFRLTRIASLRGGRQTSTRRSAARRHKFIDRLLNRPHRLDLSNRETDVERKPRADDLFLSFRRASEGGLAVITCGLILRLDIDRPGRNHPM